MFASDSRNYIKQMHFHIMKGVHELLQKVIIHIQTNYYLLLNFIRHSTSTVKMQGVLSVKLKFLVITFLQRILQLNVHQTYRVLCAMEKHVERSLKCRISWSLTIYVPSIIFQNRLYFYPNSV